MLLMQLNKWCKIPCNASHHGMDTSVHQAAYLYRGVKVCNRGGACAGVTRARHAGEGAMEAAQPIQASGLMKMTSQISIMICHRGRYVFPSCIPCLAEDDTTRIHCSI